MGGSPMNRGPARPGLPLFALRNQKICIFTYNLLIFFIGQLKKKKKTPHHNQYPMCSDTSVGFLGCYPGYQAMCALAVLEQLPRGSRASYCP